MHAERGWHWSESTDAFEVIVGAILVQNTSWTNVERALDNLNRADVLSASAMDALSNEELETLIRPSGQYRQKAKKLEAFLSAARERGGVSAMLALPPPTLRKALLETWGIGPETADVIVLYGAKAPMFVIDAYTRRLFGRLDAGPDSALPYASWQAFFEERLPTNVDLWGRYHSLIVMHCKFLCTRSRPKCSSCELAPSCPGSTREHD